jgi:hypothetical protein
MEHSGALGDLLKVESPCMLLTKLKTVARKQVHWLIPREKKKTLGLLAAEAGDQSSAVASWTWSSSSSGISRSAGRRRRAARSPWPRRRRALLRHHEIAKGFSSRIAEGHDNQVAHHEIAKGKKKKVSVSGRRSRCPVQAGGAVDAQVGEPRRVRRRPRRPPGPGPCTRNSPRWSRSCGWPRTHSVEEDEGQ